MPKKNSSLPVTITRGLRTLLLSLFIVLIASNAYAVLLKIKIVNVNNPHKEYLVLVNGIAKPTTNQEVMFDVSQGASEIEIGHKKLTKMILRPSLLQIQYKDE